MTESSKPGFSPQRRTVVAGAVAAFSQQLFPATSLATHQCSTSIGREKMDIERFVEDCVIANRETDAQTAVKDVLARAVSTPGAVMAALGDPSKAGLNVLLSSATLTIRSQWKPETLEEEPSDAAIIRGIFERENERPGLT